jgi:hypothetical protein
MLASIHDLAKRELNEAALYYESERHGVGQAFVTEVERCTEAIPNSPRRVQSSTGQCVVG